MQSCPDMLILIYFYKINNCIGHWFFCHVQTRFSQCPENVVLMLCKTFELQVIFPDGVVVFPGS